MNKNTKKSERGIVSVYMALTIMLIMSASAIVLSDIVARQMRLASDVEFTARSFYAASTGIEHLYHTVVNSGVASDGLQNPITIPETIISYGAGGNAVYTPGGHFIRESGGGFTLCITSSGRFRESTRRMEVIYSNC